MVADYRGSAAPEILWEAWQKQVRKHEQESATVRQTALGASKPELTLSYSKKSSSIPPDFLAASPSKHHNYTNTCTTLIQSAYVRIQRAMQDPAAAAWSAPSTDNTEVPKF